LGKYGQKKSRQAHVMKCGGGIWGRRCCGGGGGGWCGVEKGRLSTHELAKTTTCAIDDWAVAMDVNTDPSRR
jgi:hypothetical protein